MTIILLDATSLTIEAVPRVIIVNGVGNCAVLANGAARTEGPSAGAPDFGGAAVVQRRGPAAEVGANRVFVRRVARPIALRVSPVGVREAIAEVGRQAQTRMG